MLSNAIKSNIGEKPEHDQKRAKTTCQVIELAWPICGYPSIAERNYHYDPHNRASKTVENGQNYL